MNYSGAPESQAPGVAEGVPAGTVIGGRFRVESFLGAGGLGELYRALDLKTQKPIAVRLLARDLAADERVLDRLREHVKSASALQHKNIGATFGLGKEGSQRYVALELIEGQSLRQLIDKKRQAGRTFSLKGAYNVLAHVCNALDQAHKASFVHGLPGPGVILINKVGRVKVCEFGVARALPPEMLRRLGDAYCLAPELAPAPAMASPVSDIYALGVVLYELLTSRRPEDFVPPSALVPGLPRDVDEVMYRAIHADPAQRFSDAQQLKSAFYASVQGANEQADVEGTVDPAAAAAAARPAPVAAIPAPVPARPAPHTVETASDPGAVPAPAQPPPQRTTGSMPTQTPRPAPARAAAPAPASQPEPARGGTLEEHIARARNDHAERWLIQKDRLDFGPFALADLMQQMVRGQFSGDDVVLDQDTGERTRLRMHPLLREFCQLVDQHLAAERAVQAEQVQASQSRRRRTTILIVVSITFIIVAAGGAVTAYLLTREPQTKERIVIKEKRAEVDLNKIEVSWKAEPPDQAARRKKLARRRPGGKGIKGGDDVQHLGDASKEGGDALLSQAQVQQTMMKSFGKLKACIYEELRRTPGLRQVNIDFGVRGSGIVSSATVNGMAGGPFTGCMLAKMQSIRFPKFDGTLTRASFSMTLK